MADKIPMNPKKRSKTKLLSERKRYVGICGELGYRVESDDSDEEDIIWFSGPHELAYSMLFDFVDNKFVGIYLQTAVEDTSSERIRDIEKYIAQEYRVTKCWYDDEALCLAFEFFDLDDDNSQLLIKYGVDAMTYAFKDVMDKFSEVF